MSLSPLGAENAGTACIVSTAVDVSGVLGGESHEVQDPSSVDGVTH